MQVERTMVVITLAPQEAVNLKRMLRTIERLDDDNMLPEGHLSTQELFQLTELHNQLP